MLAVITWVHVVIGMIIAGAIVGYIQYKKGLFDKWLKK
jgi:hypothetical protein